MQVNFTNFIRFYTGTPNDETMTIPRLALIDNRCYKPVFVPYERASFYCNANVPFLDGDDINNLELRILDASGDVAANMGAILQRVALSDGYRFYTDFVFPGIGYQDYQFEVFNTDTDVPKLVSNWFTVMGDSEADLITASVVWRNSRSAYYYDWILYPDLYSRVRLHLSLQSYTPEGTVEQLQSVNTGRRRNLNRTVDKSVRLQTYFFDDGANDACIALFEADYIEINGKQYLAKTIYNPNARPNSKVSTGEIELFEQDFSSINKYGQVPIELTNNGYVAFYNDSNTIFQLKAYRENNSLFNTVNVPVGETLFYPIENIPYNGRVDFVPSGAGTYDVIAMDVVNKNVSLSDTSNSNAVTLSLTRVQIYNHDWFLVIS